MRKLRLELLSLPKVAENINGAEELIQFLTPNPLQPPDSGFHLCERGLFNPLQRRTTRGMGGRFGKKLSRRLL